MSNCILTPLGTQSERLAELVSEVIVVDTGSTDETRQVAAAHGAKVIDFPWCDNFAAARNECLKHASGDWILWLDADEFFDETNRQKLRELFAGLKDEKAAYVMTQRSRHQHGDAGARVRQVRLFRRHPAVGWEYRVHEQLLPSLRRGGFDVRFTDITLEHTGYQDPALRRRKLERNLRLLHLDQADQAAEAAAACRTGRVRCPDDPELLFLDGTQRRGTGDWVGAEGCWRQVVATDLQSVVSPADCKSAATGGGGEPGAGGAADAGRHLQEARPAGRGGGAIAGGAGGKPDLLSAWLALAELCRVQKRFDEVENIARALETSGNGDAALLRARLLLEKPPRWPCVSWSAWPQTTRKPATTSKSSSAVNSKSRRIPRVGQGEWQNRSFRRRIQEDFLALSPAAPPALV